MSGGPPRLPSFFRLVAFDTIGSTSEEARRLAAGGADEGTLVWARAQTAGRGRRGRGWISSAGNLYLSLVLRPGCPPATAPQLGFVTAVALADALDVLLPISAARPRLKWPNDVLVDDRKIAGILLDAATAAEGGLDWLVVGLGLNVASFPDGTDYGATSLHDAGAGAATVEQALEVLGVHWLSRLEQWQRDGFAPIRQQWLDRAIGVGNMVAIQLGRETLSGRFVELGDAGALILELPRGERRVVTAGDVCYPAL